MEVVSDTREGVFFYRMTLTEKKVLGETECPLSSEQIGGGLANSKASQSAGQSGFPTLRKALPKLGKKFPIVAQIVLRFR